MSQKLSHKNWHSMSENEIFENLKTQKSGLAQKEAEKRLKIFGLNEIKEEKKHTSLKLIVSQYTSPLIIILLIATTISFFLGETIDATIIAAIIIFSTMIGFIQEYRSGRAIEALKRLAANTVIVIRDGHEKTINANELVPGDVILVSVGDKIPADAYLLEQFDLETDEASLSGESTPVEKQTGTFPEDAGLPDRKNILYMITTAIHGRAKAVVFATGMNTELGKVAESIQTIETVKSPFELRMKSIGKTLSIIMLVVVGVITFVGLLRGFELMVMFVWGTSLAVAAVPEALPAVVTASLTIGVYKMAKQNAVVRRMSAVETLGSTTTICSDKTGTLTKGEMTVKKIFINKKFYEVTGTGYEIEGSIKDLDIDTKELKLFGQCAVLCNDASLRMDEKNIVPIGDTTEASLIVFGEKIGIKKQEADIQYPRKSEIQFSSERKRMTTVNVINNKQYAFTKGATESVLSCCSSFLIDGTEITLDNDLRNLIVESTNSLAKDGLRVLALAYKKIGTQTLKDDIESNMIFLGLIGMMDPPRAEARDAVLQCKQAGIRVIMITGDHQLTAESIAKDLGILTEETQSITGRGIDELGPPQLEKLVQKITVYSRVTSDHKMRIVQALKKTGNIVAMTGDGINDATALKSADIGIAMGITGTQVTKEASSMILTDDNFASIVSAVKQGRRIMDNVKKYLVYLLPVNIGEIILFGFTIAVGWPIPLLAKHILYVNLATDGSPAIALGMEPAEKGIMSRKPSNPKSSIFAGTFEWFIGISLIIGIISIVLFWYVLEVNGWNEFAIDKARTMVFVFLIFEEIFFALSCKSLRLNLHKTGLFGNKFLLYALLAESTIVLLITNFPVTMKLFDLVSLNSEDWILIFILSPAALVYSEILKFCKKMKFTKLIKS